MESFTSGIEKGVEQASEKVATFFDKLEGALDVDKPDIAKSINDVKTYWESLENAYLSTYEERLNQTPTDKTTERGYWDGERGESKYIPVNEEIKQMLAKYGLDGVTYHDGIPDFSACSGSTVEIENMSENRESNKAKGITGNFEQADQKAAGQWNSEGRDGKTNWTARDVTNWRRENGYSWHECNDRKTCQLIPTKINDYFGHFGGVGECKKANAKEDQFDE